MLSMMNNLNIYNLLYLGILSTLVLSITLPIIGIFSVYTKNALITDVLSHSAITGVLIAIMIGYTQHSVLFSVVFSSVLLLSVEYFEKKKETGLVLLSTFSIGLFSLLSNKINSQNLINSLLFGSIITVTKEELITLLIILIIVYAFLIKYYKKLCFYFINEEVAKLRGINVKALKVTMIIITSIVISASVKIAGSLLVSSLAIIPVMIALLISKSYKQTILYSIVFSVISGIVGVILSVELNLRISGTIALTTLILYVIVFTIKKIKESLL